MIIIASAILNSFLTNTFLYPSNKNGTIGSEYLIKSLCATNNRGVKNMSEK